MYLCRQEHAFHSRRTADSRQLIADSSQRPTPSPTPQMMLVAAVAQVAHAHAPGTLWVRRVRTGKRLYQSLTADARYSYEIWHMSALLARASHIKYGVQGPARAPAAGLGHVAPVAPLEKGKMGSGAQPYLGVESLCYNCKNSN
jgi:hypothetical protein